MSKLFLCGFSDCVYQSEKKCEVFHHKLKVHILKKAPNPFQLNVQSTCPDIDMLNPEKQLDANGAYSCQICGKKFPFPSRLKRHFAMDHEKKKRFQCVMCFFSHYHLNQVKEHYKKKHKDVAMPADKHFICDPDKTNDSGLRCCECGQESSTPHQMRLHMQKSHPYMLEITQGPSLPYSCTECDQGFKRRTQLRQHVAVHHEKLRRFECTECSYQSYLWSYMKEHFLSVHAQLTIPSTVKFKIKETTAQVSRKQ